MCIRDRGWPPPKGRAGSAHDWTCVTCCAPHCYEFQFFTKFEVGLPIRSWLMLLVIRYITLWLWTIKLRSWTLSVHVSWLSQYQIWAKSNNTRLCYCDLNKPLSNLAPFAILNLTGSGLSQFCELMGPHETALSNFNSRGKCTTELLVIQSIFTARLSAIQASSYSPFPRSHAVT